MYSIEDVISVVKEMGDAAMPFAVRLMQWSEEEIRGLMKAMDKPHAVPEGMKLVNVHVAPYADQYADMYIPKELDDEAAVEYVQEHFNELMFSDPELDYAGIDIDINE